MELYDQVAYSASQTLTLRYSNSFGLSSKLFDTVTASHIYAVYGLVRVADEIVDTYKGSDSAQLLSDLAAEVNQALRRAYSANPVVHAFALTARQFGIDSELIKPFFKSMAMDLTPQIYTKKLYQTYIYGSAEVVGLMCLKIFTAGDQKLYDELATGAQALGAAFQKVNFLRDVASDHNQRQRFYFPGSVFETFDEAAKYEVVDDIRADLDEARPAIAKLPPKFRRAVMLSFVYYTELLDLLESEPVQTIKTKRISVAQSRKLWLFSKSLVTAKPL